MAKEATEPSIGSWVDIPIDDNVISLAHWAVNEYNKEKGTHLEFRGVWRAKEQIVEGTMYWFRLHIADGGRINNYEAKVFVSLTNVKELKEFELVLVA